MRTAGLQPRGEWELAARGADLLDYPTGNQFDEFFFNNNNGLLAGGMWIGPREVQDLATPRPGAPAGLIGNVGEWTTSPHPEGGLVLKGADWLAGLGDLYGLGSARRRAEPAQRHLGLGFRCVLPAPEGEAAPPGMVRIPGGEFVLGTPETPVAHLVRELQSHGLAGATVVLQTSPLEVRVPGFEIDRCEVTNGSYGRFLEWFASEGDHRHCHPDEPQDKDHTPEYWSDPLLSRAAQPVVGVDWYDAWAYSRWSGARLPTADELQRAADVEGGRLYPWGNEFDPPRCVTAEGGFTAPLEADSLPEGAAKTGVLHLVGNADEWTLTDSDHDEGSVVLMGGGFSDAGRSRGLLFRRDFVGERGYRGKELGFRCVVEPGD